MDLMEPGQMISALTSYIKNLGTHEDERTVLYNGPTKHRTGHKFSIFCSRLTAPEPQFACTR